MQDPAPPRFYDTHTHFDEAVFDNAPLNRLQLAQQARLAGVDRLLIAGYRSNQWSHMQQVQAQLNAAHLQATQHYPRVDIAFGLHPVYIAEHTANDLTLLEQTLSTTACTAVGEIGLDGYSPQLKAQLDKQKLFFAQQLQLAKAHDKPIILHIRKCFAETLQLLNASKFSCGGIAHAYGGGVEEAKRLLDLNFKLGIGGMLTQPNPRKLLAVISSVGIKHLVLETDCPDMLPLPCRQRADSPSALINVPANISVVFDCLCQCLSINTPQQVAQLAQTLYANSLTALHIPA